MHSSWIKLLILSGLACFPRAGLLANFSDSHLALHPVYPGSGPFIIEIEGTWPNDCHPGEQKPVVKSFDGQTVVIEFEIIVVHVTCNLFDTPYRVLVDMSEAIRQTPTTGEVLDLRIAYQATEKNEMLPLLCPAGFSCPLGSTLPERGLYTTPGRADEGLLVARQNDVMVIYPLVYDEAGRGEWLISVGRVIEDSFFAELFRSQGGDCFDCEPSNPDTELSPAGYLSVLVDRPGSLQLKVNDRPFSEYTKLVYGYKNPLAGLPGGPLLAGLGGRWALTENQGSDPPLGDITNFLPAAFDITLQSLQPGEHPQVTYLVSSIANDELGQLVCGGKDAEGQPLKYCEFIDETDQIEPLFRFYQEGPSSLTIEFGRPIIAIGFPPGGKAVRLD